MYAKSEDPAIRRHEGTDKLTSREFETGSQAGPGETEGR